MMSVPVCGRPISGQPQTRVGSPSAGSGARRRLPADRGPRLVGRPSRAAVDAPCFVLVGGWCGRRRLSGILPVVGWCARRLGAAGRSPVGSGRNGPGGTNPRRPLPARFAAGSWRDGQGVCGHRPGPGAAGGGQGAQPVRCSGPVVRGAVPPGSPRRGPVEPSQHRGRVRQRLRRRPALSGDGVRARPEPGPAAGPPGPAYPPPGRRAGHPGVRGPGRRPRPGAGPPRHQARQRAG